MCRGVRLIVAVLALVLGLHVFMLAGLGDHHDQMPLGGGVAQLAATSPAGTLAGPAAVGHDMAVGCLAMLTGMILFAAAQTGSGRRWRWEPRHSPVPRATPPAAPPPIVLGISRT